MNNASGATVEMQSFRTMFGGSDFRRHGFAWRVQVPSYDGNMLAIFPSYAREIMALLTVVFAFGLNRVFRPRAKMIYSVRHAFTFLVDQPLIGPDGSQVQPKQTINTASISVSNLGIEPAKNVEITFNWKPPFLNVWPARHFDARDTDNGRHFIALDSLAPGEIFGIEILSINAPLPALTAVRSDNCVASNVAMIPQPVHPRWRVILAAILMTLGLAASGWLIVALIQLVAHP